MNKIKLIETSNVLYAQLGMARRNNDYDSAQAICDQLSQTNKQLSLIEIQETADKAGKIL